MTATTRSREANQGKSSTVMAAELNSATKKMNSARRRMDYHEQELFSAAHSFMAWRTKFFDLCNAKVVSTTDTAKLLEKVNRWAIDAIGRKYSRLTPADLVDGQQLKLARTTYQLSGEIEIDDDAILHRQIDGKDIWVQAWVKLPTVVKT